jgi:predicted AAA+ superfamily ATPase
MYSAKSFQLTKDEFNYLLPALRSKLKQSGDRCYIISDNIEDLEDILNRLKGLYDNYGDLKNMVAYYCSKDGSLNPFRESVGFFKS